MDILLISTADWDNPYWTNKQHVAVQLARLGHRVLYIESQGLRAPTATTKDLRRIWTRLKRGVRPPREVRPGLWVWSPLVIPLQRYPVVRAGNRAALTLGINAWARQKNLRFDLMWTYSPLTSQLYDLKAFPLVVYHAVDDIKAQPGMPVETIAAGESDLVRRANLVFTTSPNLQVIHEATNPGTHYFPNVCDYDHFSTALDDCTVVPPDLTSIPGPRVGFIGAISGYKLDFPMIATIARKHQDWHFVFIGEIGEGDPLTDASAITKIPNIHFLGGRRYQTLPSYLKGIDVAILPSAINEYTRSMFPMKFFEYLASGRPVVATNLHALKDWADVAAICTDETAFEKAITQALENGAASLDNRLEAARGQTYESRTKKMMELVAKALSEAAPKPKRLHRT